MRNANSIAAALTVSLLLPFAAHAVGQPSKMKLCAEQYHQQKIPKNQYRSFMSQCLKKDGTRTPIAGKAAASAASTVTATTPAQKQDEGL